MKDLLVKSTSATELEFAEEAVDFLWLDNSNSDKKLLGTTRTTHTQILIRLTSMSAPATLVLHCTSFHKSKWTASNEIYREDQVVTLIVIMIPHLKKKTIDLLANVAVPGPVERQHD